MIVRVIHFRRSVAQPRVQADAAVHHDGEVTW